MLRHTLSMLRYSFKMAPFLALILVLHIVGAVEYYCDRDRFPLVTDFGFNDCPDGTFYKDNYVLDCFPGCQQHVVSLRSCDPEGLPCPPGYMCDADSTRCVLDEDSCYKYHISGGLYEESFWKPECDVDYSYAAKQCKGEKANGRCFCFDSAGNRIFGEAFSYNADDMTCGCSRRRHELETAGNNVFVSLHCDSMGNYEPLQCDIDSEQCWCADSKTGDITGKVFPMGLMSKLPCYNATTMGSQYLRQCESQLYAQSKIADELNAHGTVKSNFGTLTCQYDGSYGPYKITNSIVSCVWKDNTDLGFQATYDSSIATMTCNCARDKQIFSLAGLSHTLTCTANGNYESLQMDGAEYFCVDDDGFVKTDNFVNEPTCSNYP